MQTNPWEHLTLLEDCLYSLLIVWFWRLNQGLPVKQAGVSTGLLPSSPACVFSGSGHWRGSMWVWCSCSPGCCSSGGTEANVRPGGTRADTSCRHSSVQVCVLCFEQEMAPWAYVPEYVLLSRGRWRTWGSQSLQEETRSLVVASKLLSPGPTSSLSLFLCFLCADDMISLLLDCQAGLSFCWWPSSHKWTSYPVGLYARINASPQSFWWPEVCATVTENGECRWFV